MRVLVTGGAGFIGSHIVDALIAAGHEVAVIDDLSTGKKANVNPKAKFIELDISNPTTIETVAREKPEALFHLAAQALVTVSVKDPMRDATVNIIGLLHLLEGAVKAGTKKIVYTSTGGAIYGETEVIPTPETFWARPLSPYGIAKLSGEHYLDFYRAIHNLNATVLRYANVYGPRQNPFGEGGAVAIFTQKLLNNTLPTIFGDGSMTRDYVYVVDVVRANLLALTTDQEGPFNIGTGQETSTASLFKLVQQAVGTDLEAEFAPARPGEVGRSCLDAALAKRELKWTPEVKLTEGIRQTVEWFRVNQN